MQKSINISTLMLFLMTSGLGCHMTGPVSVKTGRADYNIAIQQTNSQQLLLNLTRLRYRDTPYFLEVASVSTNFEFGASGAATIDLPESAAKGYGLGAGVSFLESPTVTYTPLQGDEFVTQLMSPIKLDTMLLLYHSGWSVERIFRIAVQSINGIKNAPSASGPTPDYVPTYADFLQVAKTLRNLQLHGALEMGYSAPDDSEKPVIELRLTPQPADWDEVGRLCELLGLAKDRFNFRLTTEAGPGGKDRLAIVPRSLMASLFYVSQAVEVPPEDEQAGRVTTTRDEQGHRFDWQQVTGGLIRICFARHRPAHAYVAVYYRGFWFYIKDNDLTSKSTFSLLMQLFALQAGDVKSTGPILTLPVSR